MRTGRADVRSSVAVCERANSCDRLTPPRGTDHAAPPSSAVSRSLSVSSALPPSDSIEPFLADIKRRVDQQLERYFEQKRARARALSAPSLELVDALAEFTMRGGKRTRPAVLVAGHMAVSTTTDLDALLDACAGLELLQ